MDKDKAIEFIHKHHYSMIMPRLTRYYLGVYNKHGLSGVITLGWGTQPKGTIRKVFYNHDMTTEDYIEIGKMCFDPSKNSDGQSGSQMMSQLVRWVKKNTKHQFLYTLADGIMGKAGYVYQASNFHYIGSFKTAVYRDRKTGEKIHPRSARALCEENAEFEGKEKVFWLTHNFCEYKGIDRLNGLMFRYILPLTKKARRKLNSYEEYTGLDNPKDKDLLFWQRVEHGKYELVEQPEFNMEVFVHNYQKYNNTKDK